MLRRSFLVEDCSFGEPAFFGMHVAIAVRLTAQQTPSKFALILDHLFDECVSSIECRLCAGGDAHFRHWHIFKQRVDRTALDQVAAESVLLNVRGLYSFCLWFIPRIHFTPRLISAF